MKTSIPKIAECYRFLIIFQVIFKERDNFVHFSENIKYSNLNKNMVIYHKEGKRVTIGLFYGNFVQ